MTEKPPVPKYIIKKAVQLNELDKKQKALMDTIKNWMELSGFPYAGIYDESGIIMKLAMGEYENEDEIIEAFKKLNDES